MIAVDTNPGFPKSFPLKMIFQNHLTKDDFLPAPWTSYLSHHLHPFIHTWEYGCCLHSPYTPGIVQLLQKGDQSSLEPTRLVHQRKEYLCCQRLISVQSNMCSVETRTQGTMLIQLGKWFSQILYSNHLYNTNKYITSDPEILVKYYEGKVCNCEIKERCDYLILQSLYNYH